MDLNDPDVFRMATKNHIPTEEWTMGGDVYVHCEKCGGDWPCDTVRALRAVREGATGRKIRRVPPR